MSDTLQAQDQWATAPTDPGTTPAPDLAAPSSDWLNSAPIQPEHFNLLDPFHNTWLPLGSWVTQGIDWLVLHFRPLFQGIRVPVDYILNGFQHLLLGMPASIAIVLFSLIAWQVASVGMGALTLVSLIAIGLPLGTWLSRSKHAAKVIRPLLDAMQTTPAFVYLVPIVMLFGIGNVPGVVVTIIFALPPIVRMTILGINQVPEELIEAAQSFGASPRQLLFKVQLPLAMVVIASMIAVGGLGQMVLRGIGRLDMGLAAVGGVGIVILAIILDRLTRSLGRDRRSKSIGRWYAHNPVGLLTRPFIKKRDFFAAGGVRPRRATVLTLKTEEKLCAPQGSGR